MITASCINNQQCMMRCLCDLSHAVLEIKRKKRYSQGRSLSLFTCLESEASMCPWERGMEIQVPLCLSERGSELKGWCYGTSCQGGALLPECVLLYRDSHLWGTTYSQMSAVLHLGGQGATRGAIGQKWPRICYFIYAIAYMQK